MHPKSVINYTMGGVGRPQRSGLLNDTSSPIGAPSPCNPASHPLQPGVQQAQEAHGAPHAPRQRASLMRA